MKHWMRKLVPALLALVLLLCVAPLAAKVASAAESDPQFTDATVDSVANLGDGELGVYTAASFSKPLSIYTKALNVGYGTTPTQSSTPNKCVKIELSGSQAYAFQLTGSIPTSGKWHSYSTVSTGVSVAPKAGLAKGSYMASIDLYVNWQGNGDAGTWTKVHSIPVWFYVGPFVTFNTYVLVYDSEGSLTSIDGSSWVKQMPPARAMEGREITVKTSPAEHYYLAAVLYGANMAEKDGNNATFKADAASPDIRIKFYEYQKYQVKGYYGTEAKFLGPDDTEPQTTTWAYPGDTVWVKDISTNYSSFGRKNVKGFYDWSGSDVKHTFDPLDDLSYGASFVMPANTVRIMIQREFAAPKFFTFSNGSMTINDNGALLTSLNCYNVNKTKITARDYIYDLDCDGTDDIEVKYVATGDSSNPYTGIVTKLSGSNLGALYELLGSRVLVSNVYYAPITFVFDESKIHTVTVINGVGSSMLSDEVSTVQAIEGETVWISTQMAACPAGQYAAGFRSTDGSVPLQDLVLGWNFYDGTFQMVDHDITIEIVYRDMEPLTIDVSNGSWTTTDEKTAMEVGSSLEVAAYDTNWYSNDGDPFTAIYLDEEETRDLVSRTKNGYDPKSGEYVFQSMTIEKNASTNIEGRTYTVSTEKGVRYSPITVVFRDGFDVKVQSGGLQVATDLSSPHVSLQSVKAGTTVYVDVYGSGIPDGQYISGFESTDGSIKVEVTNGVYGTFKMPSKDVTLKPVLKPSTPYLLDLSSGSKTLTGAAANLMYRSFSHFDFAAISFEDTSPTSTATLDLDKDGTADIKLAMTFDTAAHLYTKLVLSKLSTCSIKDSIKMAALSGGAPYYPVTVVTSEAGLPTFTVKFDSNGGSTVASQTVKYGRKATKPADPKRTGYTFKGWYNGSTLYDFSKVVNTDLTLKAKWEIIKFTVKFDADGGSAVASQTVNYGAKATRPADPTKTGYDFKGWYNGSTLYDFSKAVTANLTLKAKWEIKTYTVTFDSDGGSTVASQAVKHGAKAAKPADPSKFGYTFKGWYNGSTKYDFNKAVTSNLTLKAKWEKTEAGTTDTIPVIMNGASLTLEGQITVNFFVKVPAGSTAKTVKLTYAKGGTKTYALDTTAKYYDGKEYKLAFPNIPAKEMTVPITLKVYDAKGNQLKLEHYKTGALKNDEYQYCAADWAKNKIATSGTAEKTLYLAKALLNYGDYAQKYFKYNTSNPANPNGYLSSEMGGVKANAAFNAVIPADAKTKLGYNGASLILEGATSIRLYFKEKVTAKNGSGKAYTLKQSGSEWYVEIPNVAAKDLDVMYKVIVTKDGKDYTFQYSALSYANGRLTNSSAKADIKNLCKALYLYNDAANKYFAK